MEELIYQLNTIVLIRSAISQVYSSTDDTDRFIACVSIMDDLEEQLITQLIELHENR